MAKSSSPVVLGAAVLVIGGAAFGAWFFKEKQARDAQYDAEIESLQKLSKINADGASRLADLGGLGASIGYLHEAAAQEQKVTCLKEQKDKNISFYEGKSICESAVKPRF